MNVLSNEEDFDEWLLCVAVFSFINSSDFVLFTVFISGLTPSSLLPQSESYFVTSAPSVDGVVKDLIGVFVDVNDIFIGNVVGIIIVVNGVVVVVVVIGGSTVGSNILWTVGFFSLFNVVLSGFVKSWSFS